MLLYYIGGTYWRSETRRMKIDHIETFAKLKMHVKQVPIDFNPNLMRSKINAELTNETEQLSPFVAKRRFCRLL